MAVFTIFSHAVRQSYKTTICSKATVFYSVSSILAILLPLLVAFKSEGFWRKFDVYREHPEIHFKHQLLIVLETGSGIKPIVWSTFHNLNLVQTANACYVENYEEDVDDDGFNDKLELSISIPVPPDENVFTVTMLLLFDYKMQHAVDLQMESLAYIHHSSGIPGSKFQLTGELRLNQKEPIRHHAYHYKYNTSVLNTSTLDKNFDLETIVKAYSSRTVTTHLGNTFPIWKSGRGPQQKFSVKLTILYPEETVLCQLGFWQLLKWAWIQYISLLFIALYITHKVKVFIFQHQVFPTVRVSTFKEHYS